MSVLNYLQIMHEKPRFDKTGLFSVGVNSFDRLFLKKRPISSPMVQNSIESDNMINEYR